MLLILFRPQSVNVAGPFQGESSFTIAFGDFLYVVSGFKSKQMWKDESDRPLGFLII